MPVTSPSRPIVIVDPHHAILSTDDYEQDDESVFKDFTPRNGIASVPVVPSVLDFSSRSLPFSTSVFVSDFTDTFPSPADTVLPSMRTRSPTCLVRSSSVTSAYRVGY